MTIPSAIFVVDKETNVLYDRRTNMDEEVFARLLFVVSNLMSDISNLTVPNSNFTQTECNETNQRIYLFSLTRAKLYISYNKESSCLVTEQDFISNFFSFLTGLKVMIDFYKKGFVDAVRFVNFITVMDEVFNNDLTVIPTLDEIHKIINLYSINERLERVQEEEKMKAMSQQFRQFSLLKEMMEGENTVAPNSSEAYRIKRKENKKLQREKKEREDKLKLEKGHAIENEELEHEESVSVDQIGLKLR